jgi:hypothetical protein
MSELLEFRIGCHGSNVHPRESVGIVGEEINGITGWAEIASADDFEI